MFDIMPAAKEEVFSSLIDAVIIVDLKGNLVEINGAASDLLNIKVTNSAGITLEEAIPTFPSLTAAIRNGDSTELSIGSYWGVRHYAVNISNLNDRRKRKIGTIVIMHDITKRKSLENELIQMASTDPLTGASNRRHLFELAEREYSRAKRYGRDLCAVMIDIDGFKQLNDKYGHDVGDEALRRMVSTCGEEIRSSDLFGRIGGEEFVAVLADQNLEQATLAAERLRTRIADIAVPVGEGETGFTASLGVALLAEDDTSFEDLLKRADTALYAAKMAGRNCVRTG
jgi:diguanylate cyclase (GGDEF)-like protein